MLDVMFVRVVEKQKQVIFTNILPKVL